MKKIVDYQRLTIQPSTKRDDDPMFPSDKHCFDSSGCISRRCQCHWNGRLSDLGHLPRKLATSWCQGWSPMKHGLWRRNVWGVLFCWIQDLLSKSQDVFRLIMINLDYIYTLSNLRPFFFAFFNMYLFFAFFRKKGTKDAKKVHKLNWMGIPCSQAIPRVDSAQLFPCQLVPVDDVQISADCALHCTIKLRINFGELSCLDVNYKSSYIYLWNPWSSLSSDILVIVYSGANMSQHLTGV